MTTGLSYDGTVVGTTSYVAQIATMAVVSPTDDNFLIALPQAITYAENRMYRELDLLSTSDALPFQLTAGNRYLDISGGVGNFPFVITEQINVITPSTETNPDSSSATRNPCIATTKEFVDQVYGSSAPANRGVPQYFVPFNDNSFLIAPTPDLNYIVEIIGVTRPASLSATNKTTFLSIYMPDIFIMASMIYISAFQRNFSSISANDPQMPINYESQYKVLMASATVEEDRKKFEASAWSSQGATPNATPSRSP